MWNMQSVKKKKQKLELAELGLSNYFDDEIVQKLVFQPINSTESKGPLSSKASTSVIVHSIDL